MPLFTKLAGRKDYSADEVHTILKYFVQVKISWFSQKLPNHLCGTEIVTVLAKRGTCTVISWNYFLNRVGCQTVVCKHIKHYIDAIVKFSLDHL